MFKRLAAKRNMRVTQFNGSLNDVIRLDLPFIVVTNVTGNLGAYCYAITAVKNDNLSISPTLFNSNTISRDVVASLSSGTFYLVWQNHGQIPYTLTKDERRFEIRTLQRLLKQAGFYKESINGTYTASTITAVNRYQQSIGIPTNDSLGEQTLAALTRFDTSRKIPSLTQGNLISVPATN